MLPAHFCKIFTQPSTLDMNGKGYDRQFWGQRASGLRVVAECPQPRSPRNYGLLEDTSTIDKLPKHHPIDR